MSFSFPLPVSPKASLNRDLAEKLTVIYFSGTSNNAEKHLTNGNLGFSARKVAGSDTSTSIVPLTLVLVGCTTCLADFILLPCLPMASIATLGGGTLVTVMAQ